MFSLIKGIIWLVGFVVVTMFVMSYFGYEVNKNYFQESKEKCLEELVACQKEYIRQGIDNAQCAFDCVDPKLILLTKPTEPSDTNDQEVELTEQTEETSTSQDQSDAGSDEENKTQEEDDKTAEKESDKTSDTLEL